MDIVLIIIRDRDMINKFSKMVRALLNTKPIYEIPHGLNHSIQGLVTEVGEIVDLLKKHCYYGKVCTTLEFKEELGDLLFYVESTAQAVKSSLDELQELMIAKHGVRYPDGVFDATCALERDKDAELEAMREVERKYHDTTKEN